MNIKQKVQLLAVLPVAIGMMLVIVVTQYQFDKLSLETSAAYKSSVTERRKEELQNYVMLALSSIDHLYNNDDIDQGFAQEQAQDVLSNLVYKDDGYFFAYTSQGVGIVHPKQPFRIGKNWWELQDETGAYLLQELIRSVQDGDGYLQYQWVKPSGGEVGTKMAYSVKLEKWDWVLGTGIHIDDVNQQVFSIQESIDRKISNASFVILAIGIIAVIVVYMTGILLQFNERKLADEKLQALTKRILTAQEDERRRVSRELHDGIGQLIASVKFSIETASLKLSRQESAEEDLKLTRDNITQTLTDLRRISRDLHPRILDDHGLSAGLESLVINFSQRTGIQANLEKVAVKNLLSPEIRTTLYRIAQEALTNVERHSQATTVDVSIALKGRWIVLSIFDNGLGFDVDLLNRSKLPDVGIGLRNMQERLSYHKGMFVVKSNTKGTLIEAKIPKSALKFT